MKTRFRGIYTCEEFFQALFDERQKFRDHGIKFIRGATLYYTPVDEYGDPVTPVHKNGEPMHGWSSDGPYRSAADIYDPPGGRKP